jgi:hypothetical protein
MRFEGIGAAPGKVLGRAVVFVHKSNGTPLRDKASAAAQGALAGQGVPAPGTFLGLEEELERFRGAVKINTALDYLPEYTGSFNLEGESEVTR